ncbi:MAG: hypothetical protein H6831_04445 [Planctomycetes bacterium]|nr:hypothetical protein [Planctomycetota bacterium]MCB9903638.1 hypothetical protein [Planctomycetota bacterium]
MTIAPSRTFEPHLEHARAAWRAEEENARRHATRKALIVGIPLAATALSGALAEPSQVVFASMARSELRGWGCFLLSIITVYHVAQVLIRALPVRPASYDGSHRSVSEGLNPVPVDADRAKAEQAVDEFIGCSDAMAKSIAISRTLLAAHELHKANERTNTRLQSALESVSQAFGTFIVAAILYFLIL